jgi:CheY-like chemotaxis protein
MTKILLVEDDKSLREIYGVRLLAEGYDIVSAGDGEEALAMAIKDRPDLIVSDVMMPKISGFDMLDILRSTTETRDIKVIMMTALSSEDQRKRGEQLGADRYLVKSQVGIEDVVRTVHEVLADAPVAAPAGNIFAAPAPSAVARPEPAPVAPAPVTPVSTQVVAPVPAPQPVAQPQIPVATAQPVPPVPEPVAAPAPQPLPAPSALPQPTAPFSSPRPAGLGDRIIQPITQPQSDGPALADLMQNELNGTTTPSPQPATPVTTLTMPAQVAVAPPPAPVAPGMVMSSTPLAYEETPVAPQPPTA